MDELIADRVRRYNQFPTTIAGRKAFLNTVYGDTFNNKPIARMEEEQIYAVAKNVYEAGHAFDPHKKYMPRLFNGNKGADQYFIEDSANNQESVLREMNQGEENIAWQELEARLLD